MNCKLVPLTLAGSSAIALGFVGLALSSASPDVEKLHAENMALMPQSAAPGTDPATLHLTPSQRTAVLRQAAHNNGVATAISQTDASVDAGIVPNMPVAASVTPHARETILFWRQLGEKQESLEQTQASMTSQFNAPPLAYGRIQLADASVTTNDQIQASNQAGASARGSFSPVNVAEQQTEIDAVAEPNSSSPLETVSADPEPESFTSSGETEGQASNNQEPIDSSTPGFFAVSEFGFTVYDAKRGDGFGELQSPWKDLKVYYAGSLWRSGGRSHVDTVAVANRAAALVKPALICLDVEHWLSDAKTDKEVEEAIDKHILMIRTFREAAPEGTMIGYYSMLPHRSYWAPVSRDPEKFEAWQRRNQQLDRLAEEVDVIFPSLYCFYDDLDGWKVYAEANLAEAKRYGKPIVPFLWPRYHTSNPDIGGQFIPADQWSEMLKTVYQHTPRVVIWDWIENHDADDEWWKATQKFIEAKKNSAFASYD